MANVYDQWYANYEAAMIEALAELTRGVPTLELGIGTGRVALPLQEKGIAVHGIDISPAMIEKLRSKPGGDKIQVTMGNFADVAVDGQFTLIYVVFNTFFGLLTQADQIRCIENVAKRLEPDGSFVVEAFMPDLSRFTAQQAFRVVSMGENEVRLDAAQIDPVAQQITNQHITLTERGVQLYPVKMRYVWPAELDLMARLAGLQIRERWGNWDKSPFENHSGKHISIYEHIR